MDRVGAAPGRDVKDLGHVQVGLGRSRPTQRVGLVGEGDEQRIGIGVGIDRHARQPGIDRGPDHSDGDLAAVGDKHLADTHVVPYHRQISVTLVMRAGSECDRRAGVGRRDRRPDR